MLSSCTPQIPEKIKKEYSVETISAKDLPKNVMIKKSALMKAGTQTRIVSPVA